MSLRKLIDRVRVVITFHETLEAELIAKGVDLDATRVPVEAVNRVLGLAREQWHPAQSVGADFRLVSVTPIVHRDGVQQVRCWFAPPRSVRAGHVDGAGEALFAGREIALGEYRGEPSTSDVTATLCGFIDAKTYLIVVESGQDIATLMF